MILPTIIEFGLVKLKSIRNLVLQPASVYNIYLAGWTKKHISAATFHSVFSFLSAASQNITYLLVYEIRK